METITFTASATYPKERVLWFAQQNGYIENEEQTAEEFVQDFIKNRLVSILVEPTLDEINQTMDAQKLDQLQLANDAIEEMVDVTYD